MPFCRKCGNEFADNDAFCNKCGTALIDKKEAKKDAQIIRNTIIWWVAFMPLIGLVIENALAVIFRTPIGNLWWITLVINIILCCIDLNTIKKVHPDISILKAWVFLIPVYLFKRARALKQNLSYFFVWIAMFCLISFVPQSIILNNSLLSFGLGSSQTIDTVKNGYFFNYPEMTAGQAIDSYLINEKWMSFVSDTGQVITQVEGKTPALEGLEQHSLLVQFIVDGSSFNIIYLSVDGQPQDSNYFAYFIDVIYGKA